MYSSMLFGRNKGVLLTWSSRSISTSLYRLRFNESVAESVSLLLPKDSLTPLLGITSKKMGILVGPKDKRLLPLPQGFLLSFLAIRKFPRRGTVYEKPSIELTLLFLILFTSRSTLRFGTG